MYTFCRVFHQSPQVYFETDDATVSRLLMIHQEVKKKEIDDMNDKRK